MDQLNEFLRFHVSGGEDIDPRMIEHLKSPKFSAYGFDSRIVETIEKLGFKTPTNIQVLTFHIQGDNLNRNKASFINGVN